MSFRVPSPTSHNFARVPSVQTPRSQFDRSSGLKTTFDAGFIVPIYVDEALPGDTHNLRMTSLIRMATPLHPFMDNVYADFFFFAVPNRLVWDNWERMNGARTNPSDSVDYILPTVTPSGDDGWTYGSLSDYFGIPTGVRAIPTQSLFHRSYNLIWNEWFRDQNLQDSVEVPTDDGPDDPSLFNLLRRGKRHDYFTSCLPWPQKGEAVDIPLGVSAPVLSNSGTPNSNRQVSVSNEPSGQRVGIFDSSYPPYYQEPGSQFYADLSNAIAPTINDLRQAFQLQKMLEKDARGGTRYIEILKSHFGVVSPDARLQRPEYLGGGSIRINVNPIAQTSSTDGTSPQGNLAAMAYGVADGIGFVKSFVEHCSIIGFVSIRADLTYQQGLDRMFSRSTRYDFYWPSLAMIGEQAVLNKEIYLGAGGVYDPVVDDAVFGYQERFAEYRYKPSKITGAFRSSYATTLDSWHLAQDFEDRPTLSSQFIEENPPIDRVIVVQEGEPQFIADFYFKNKTARLMPTFGVPGLIDHF